MLHVLTQSPWVVRTGWVLVHSLWQFALVALLAAILQWMLRRRSATLRYGVLLAAMSIIVVVPAATWFAIGPIERPLRAGVPASAGLPENSRLKAELQRTDFPPPQFSDDLPGSNAPPRDDAKPPAAAIPHEPEPHEPAAWLSKVKMQLEPWLPAIVLVWLAGVAVFAFRPMASWYTVRRLRTVGVAPVATSIRDILDRVAKQLRVNRAVTILQSTLVKTPVVIGYVRPLVLLPLCIVTGLPESQLELILAHELAHIRRHDYLINLLQTLIETLFFYHPAVWWLSRRIRHERENCCDDIALSLSANRADYGRALLAIEELRAAAPALSVAAGGGSLLTRIRRIVNVAEPKAPVTRSSSLLVLAGILTLAMVAGRYALLGHAKDVKSDKSPSDAAAKTDDVPGDVLEGIVVDEQGKPVAGAIIRAREYTEEDSTTNSGADGRFRLAVRAPYVIKGAITASDARENQRGIATSRFPNNPIRIVLKPSRSVDMTVVDARGQPVAGADVAALLWNGQIAAGKTDIHGKARVEIPAEASDVTILAYKSGVGMDYSSPDAANLVLDGTAPVEVKTVDSAGKLVTGLGIRIEDLTKRGKGRIPAWNAKLSAKSDGEGRAVFDYLPARVESVEFAVDAPMGTGDYVAASAAFDIRDGGDPRHITARVVRAATLRGRVTLPDGKPAAGILVQAEGRPGNANPMRYDRKWTRTARDGAYEVKVAPDQDYIIAVCDDNLAAPSHLGVIVKESEKREDLDFRLARGTLIRGRITIGPARRPANEANLTYPILDLVQKGPPIPEDWRWPDRRHRGIDQYRTSLARWADLDADGRYATRAAPGDYDLDLPSGRRRIVVADQKEMVIDDYLPDVVPKSMQGKVVDRAGKPVAGAIVAFSNNQHLITDKDGRFDAPGVMGPPRIFARSAESNLAGSQAVAKEDTRVTIELLPAATASGRVVDSLGRPAAGVNIRYDFFQHPPKENCYFPVETETDKDGKFAMSGLPIGFEGDQTYLTWYNPAKNIFEVFDGPKFTVRAGENRLPDAVLSPATKKKADKDSGKTSAVKPASDDKAIEEQAINTKSASWGYRHRRTFLADGGQFNLVGLLVTNGYWQKSLPLAPTQATAITKLDELIQQAFDNLCLDAADYMDTNPPDYQEYNARLDKRLNKAISRAERMVALGLLTEPQAALVMQRHLTNGSTGSRLYPLRDENVQELLGLTASQISGLDKVGAEANRREAPLNLWSTDPKVQQSVRLAMEANAKWLDEAAMNVLTPDQRALWSRLAAERRLPATPPDMPAPSAAEAAGIKVDEDSPVFRALAERPDDFKLSEKQKKLLDGLKEITREGLFWINRANSKNAGEFVKQAEQVALLGILTEKQAATVAQVAPADAKKSDTTGKTSAAKPADKASPDKDKPSEAEPTGQLEPPPGFLILPAYRELAGRERRQRYRIDAAQEKELQNVADAYQTATTKINEAYKESQNLSPQEKKAKIKELEADYLHANTEVRKRIGDVLTAQQKADYVGDVRYNSAIWFCGDPRVACMATGIELSQQQREQFDMLGKESRDKYRGKSERTKERLLAVLTPQQREKLLARIADADAALTVDVPPFDSSGVHILVTKLAPPPLRFSFLSDRMASVTVYPQLYDPSVRKQLALTADEEAKLQSVLVKSETAAQKIFDRFEPKTAAPKLSHEAQESQRAEYRRALEQFGKQVIAEIEAVLQPRQVAALKAIHKKSKVESMLWYHDHKALDDIHVTEEQRAKLWEIYRENAEPDVPSFRARGEKALAILTPEQRKKLEQHLDSIGP